MTKDKLDRNERAATDMMFLFIMNSDKEGHISGEGLERISTRFKDVEPEDRADVYIKFLQHLDMHDIKYDTTQFAY